MSHGSVWWYPNFVEYGAGLNPPRTWPTVREQYRPCPDALTDLRHYDLPTTESMDALYFRYPRLLPPKYRGLFRDKPHCVPRFYPGEMDLPEGKPKGFHGRMYYENGPPQFKHEGRTSNQLNYLEHPPFAPTTTQSLNTKQNLPSHINDLQRSMHASAPCDPQQDQRVGSGQHQKNGCDSWNHRGQRLRPDLRSAFYTSYPPQKITL